MAAMTVCKAEIWTTSSMKIDDSMVISKFALEGRLKVILGVLGGVKGEILRNFGL